MKQFTLPENIFWLDYETHSEADLIKQGAVNYCNHPSTGVSLTSGAFNDGPVFVIEGDALPPVVQERLADPNWIKIAWNSKFDWRVCNVVMRIDSPASQWLDAAALSMACALPGQLDRAGVAIGLAEDERKHRDGKRLIRKFSILHPNKPRATKDTDPDDWSRWVAYAQQDTQAMRIIIKKLEPYLPHVYTPFEDEVFQADNIINATGVPVDFEHCRSVVEFNEIYRKERLIQAKKITGLDNPVSPIQLKGWLEDHNVEVDNMQKGTLNDLLSTGGAHGPIAEAVRIRLELGRSSVSKFQTMLDRACPRTGRLYDEMSFRKAHTGRWAGQGVQLHNLPRGSIKGDTPEEVIRQIKRITLLVGLQDGDLLRSLYGNVGSTLSSTIRYAIHAPRGTQFLIVDYSSIETAVIAWLAGCQPLLDVFARGGDPYKDFAARLYGIPVKAVTKSQRNFAKPAVLGAVYSLGAAGYQNYAKQFGQDVTMDEANMIIDTFRETYPEIPAFWRALKNAAFKVVRGRDGMEAMAGQHITFHKDDSRFLFARLPSGRSMAYPAPEIVAGKYGDSLEYSGEVNFQWVRIMTHPGKIAENMTQAVARDLLADALVRAVDAGFEIPFHVHDEIVALAPAMHPTYTLQHLEEIMTQPPDWAEGLPVGADGFTSTHYVKL